MGKKKKISKIVDAVGYLFASAPKKEKLRKAAAFEEFLDELCARREELADQADGAADAERTRLLADVELLDTQIRKAQKLHAKLLAED